MPTCAVFWLYGSRARGTAHPESEVDLVVIAEGGRDHYGRIANDLSEEAAIAEGESPISYSVHVHDPESLQAAARSSPSSSKRSTATRSSSPGVRWNEPRSEEFMQQARDRWADAEAILGTAHPAVVVSVAYCGML